MYLWSKRLFCQGWGLALPPRPPTVNKRAVSPLWCVSSRHCLHKSNNRTPKCHRCSAAVILQPAMAGVIFTASQQVTTELTLSCCQELPLLLPPSGNHDAATRRSGPPEAVGAQDAAEAPPTEHQTSGQCWQ